MEWPFQKQPPESVIWQVGKGMKQSLTHIQASRDVKVVPLLSPYKNFTYNNKVCGLSYRKHLIEVKADLGCVD